MTDLKELAKAMFQTSMPSNPVPFLIGLEKGCRENPDFIKTDHGKMILFTLLQMAYGQAFLLDSVDKTIRYYLCFAEFQRLMQSALIFDETEKEEQNGTNA